MLLLRHVALVAAGVDVPLGHAPPGGDAVLGDNHRQGVEPVEGPQVGDVGVAAALAVPIVVRLEIVLNGRALELGEPVLQVGPDHRAHAAVNLSVGVLAGLVHDLQIVGEIGVHVVGGEEAGEEVLRGQHMLHVHAGQLLPVVRHRRRVDKGVRGGPVGEGHQPLLAVAPGLVCNEAVPHLAQQGLKGGGLRGGVQVGALVGAQRLALLVGVDHQTALPLHADEVADDPLRHVLPVPAGARAPAQGQVPVSVENVRQDPAVLQEGLENPVVIGVPVGELHVVVDPDAVEQVQGLLPALVVVVEGVVERVVVDGVDPDGVGPQVLNLCKPAQIGVVVHRVVGGPVAGNAHAQIHPPYLEGLVRAVPLHQNGLALGSGEGFHRLVLAERHVHAEPVVGRIGGEAQQGQDAHGNNEFLQRPASLRLVSG